MADTDKHKKGYLRDIWKVVSSPLVAIPLGIVMGMVAMPLIADMGTWMSIFHDPNNLRALAFQEAMKPYTGWIPFHAGLTEPGGMFYDAMTSFIEPELNTLLAQASNADAANALLQSAGETSAGMSSAPSLSALGDDCSILGTCEP